VIEPRRDAYGAEANISQLGDYLELLALAQRSLTRAELADYLGDLNWVVRSSQELYHSGGPEPAVDELPADAAGEDTGFSLETEISDRVFELLSDRAELLGDLYPFELSPTRLIRRQPVEPRYDAYVALLAITVAHHYEVSTDETPERAFESLVATAMTARGLLTVDTGAAARATGDFRAMVREAAKDVRLTAAPDAVPSRTHANEEGVDTLSHMSWGDTRPGHWLFLGQATCYQSGGWMRKIKEPLTGQWRALLGSTIEPWAYLAVPHHVEPAQMVHLAVGTNRMVLDRLRLCRHLDEVTGAQRQIIEAVERAGAYHPGYS
jgi:hypothetical protein